MKITRVIHLDMCRDGGSLVATFEGDDNIRRSLTFKIDRASRGGECYQFAYAELEEFVPNYYSGLMTNTTIEKVVCEKSRVTWEASLELLNNMQELVGFIKPRLPELPLDRRKMDDIYQRMVEAAKNSGKLRRNT